MKKKDLYIELAIGWLATTIVCIGAIINGTVEMHIVAYIVSIAMLITTAIGCYILENIKDG